MSTKKAKPTTNTSEELVEVNNTDASTEHNPLSDMPPKMQRFVHLYMTGQYTLNKLAQLLELHPNTITSWMKRKDVKDAISDMQEVTHHVVSTQLKTLTNKAVNRLTELMDSPIDAVALQAVKDVLDRSGHKQKQEIKIDKTITTVEERFKQLVDSTIVDADYEEVE